MFPELSESDVYLDTALVVNAVVGQTPDSTECVDASARLADGNRTASFSHILRIEYAQAFRRLATSQQLPLEIVHQFELQRWQHTDVRRRWLDFAFSELERT